MKFCIWFPRLLIKWISNFNVIFFTIVFKLNKPEFQVFLFIFLFLINKLDLNLFLFNITQESIDIWSIDGFNVGDLEELSNSGEYNTNMYDPVRDAVSRNRPQAESSSGGNNQGPSDPQPNQESGGGFDRNNPVDQPTDTDRLADYVRPYVRSSYHSNLGNAKITLTNHNIDRNSEMSRIASHVRNVRPDLFSKEFSKTRINSYFISELEAMKRNFPQGNPI